MWTGVEPEYIEPTKWKGSVKKDITHARIKKRLSPVELELYETQTAETAESLKHNVLDAIGIGLYVLKRYR